MVKLKLLEICAILLLALPAWGDAVQSKIVTVKVSGEGDTHQTALQECLATAVRQVYGTYVYDQQAMEDGVLTKSENLLVSKGYIKSYRVIEVSSGSAGYKLYAEVEVSLAPATKVVVNERPGIRKRHQDLNELQQMQSKLKSAAEYDRRVLARQIAILQSMFEDPTRFIEQAYSFRIVGYDVKEVTADGMSGFLKIQVDQNSAFWAHYEEILETMTTDGPHFVRAGLLHSPAEKYPKYTQEMVNHPLHRWLYSGRYGLPLSTGKLPGIGLPSYRKLILLEEEGHFVTPEWNFILDDLTDAPPEKVFAELRETFPQKTVHNAPYPVANSPFIQMGLVNGKRVRREIAPYLPHTVNVRLGNRYFETSFHIDKNAILLNHKPDASYYLLPYQACSGNEAVWELNSSVVSGYPGSLEFGGVYTAFRPDFDLNEKTPSFRQDQWPLAVTQLSFTFKVPFNVRDAKEVEEMVKLPLRVSGSYATAREEFRPLVLEIQSDMTVVELPTRVDLKN